MKKGNVQKIIRNNMPWLILLAVAVIFSFISPNFFSVANVINILNQNAYIITCAIGITLVMMAGQIDLSVGYQMSLIGVTMGLLVSKLGVPTPIVFLVAIIEGIILSEINTILALKLKITLLMVTVGTMTVYNGISFTISESKNLSGFDEMFKFVAKGYIGPLPFAVIVTTILVIIMSIFLNKTYYGRYIYALGGNEEAARLSGINVNRTKLMIGFFEGLFVALGTIMLISRVGTAHSGTGPGTEFTVITGILLGGVSIRGGEGKLSGVVAGILIMAILANGMQLAGWGTYVQFIAKGIIMLAAIGFDVYQMTHRKIVVDKTKDEKGN
ncbi:MAG: ABC transporter permease [Erysipelotrichaceae bacterium]|nr:ABC transporter permease [Erysipelotrichaceae bacterium]MBR5341670.1 ABC transporter permease [Erysipelotrichaceae bacterium]